MVQRLLRIKALDHGRLMGHFLIVVDDARDACQHVLGYGMAWGEAKIAVVQPAPA